MICASLPASALVSVPASSAVDRRAVEENGVSGGEWLPAAIVPACGTTNASADWGTQRARAVTREAKHVAVGRFIVIWGVNNELIRVVAWQNMEMNEGVMK